jgi:hypothetical protein
MKKCTNCKIEKDFGNFNKNKASKDGLNSQCNDCRKIYRAQYYKERSEEIKAKAKNYYSNNKEKAAESKQKYYQKNKDKWAEAAKRMMEKDPERVKMYKRKWRLKTQFGITLDEYDRLLKVQNNTCAICGSDHNEEEKGLFVDHNHQTGAVRGLLCSSCNTALGLFRDSPSLISNAFSYLNERGYYGPKTS